MVVPSFLLDNSTARARAATIAIAGAPAETLAFQSLAPIIAKHTSHPHCLDAVESLLTYRHLVVNKFVG